MCYYFGRTKSVSRARERYGAEVEKRVEPVIAAAGNPRSDERAEKEAQHEKEKTAAERPECSG